MEEQPPRAAYCDPCKELNQDLEIGKDGFWIHLATKNFQLSLEKNYSTTKKNSV